MTVIKTSRNSKLIAQYIVFEYLGILTMPILFHNSLQWVSDEVQAHDEQKLYSWNKVQRTSYTVGELNYCPNITQPFNAYIPISTLHSTPVANDRVCPSTMHTQVKPEDVEALKNHCGWNPLVC